ncbi:DNA repair protein XRCC1 [Grus japonensis]|uniref:DNA repair protein XRCC1 n=1 Tax=Grus japonensis TaxID=30415 RepID=A0ABC9XRT5_GRUJA
MPEIPLNRVVSVSSADPRYPAENLLKPDSGGRWRSGGTGEKQISVVLELPGDRPIHSLHIGNDGAAFVEALVGTAAGGDFQVLLPTAAFMSPGESRAGEGLRRVRLFGPDALVKGAAGRGWDRLRLVCSQPYCQTRPFGLSFVRLFSPPEDDAAPAEAPVRRLGHFTVREEGGSPRRPPGSLFYQRPPSPTAPPKDPPGPSYAVATLQASAGPSPKLPKRRPSPNPNGTPLPPTPSPPTPAPPPDGPILAGVVLALSGFQNPLRSQLRAAARGAGGFLSPRLDPRHHPLGLRLPPHPESRPRPSAGGAPGGTRLDLGLYLLDGSASSGSEGEGSEEAPPPPRPAPAPKAPPPPDPTPPGSDSDDSDAQSEREDPYGGSTEENSEEEPIPPLPDFFEDKTFFFHGEFPAGEGRRLLRYVTAFGGTLAPYMNDSVTHVVTAQDWDPAFQEALELRPSLTFVRPRWLLLCGERQRPLPAQPYALVPPPAVTSP